MMADEGSVTFKIIDVTKIPSAEAERMGKYDLVITYQDNAGRVRVVTIPYENIAGKPDAEQMKIIGDAIRAQEAERLKFLGKTITI